MQGWPHVRFAVTFISGMFAGQIANHACVQDVGSGGWFGVALVGVLVATATMLNASRRLAMARDVTEMTERAYLDALARVVELAPEAFDRLRFERLDLNAKGRMQ